jgi:type II secretory pathway pseudopilin PulG
LKYVIAALIFGSLIAGGLLWLQKSLSNAEQAGVDQQVARDIAQANQNIAERRETDAQFDKMDAAAVCRDFGLLWVFEDGKSFCR